MSYEDTPECAARLDAEDELAPFRDQFHLPEREDGSPFLYLTGNSLGLQPKRTKEAVGRVLDDWARLGVLGHLDAEKPWLPFHEFLTEPMARIVGALPHEVVVMNSLTVNLHLLMASFFQPKGHRNRIIIENNAFPSDRYAVRSHLAWRGIDPEEGLVVLGRGDLLSTEEVEQYLEVEGDRVALLLMSGVNYYSGQRFDMRRIVEASHAAGCMVGFDLAHAAGNVELDLHAWNADFAAWCSYKYLNAGPGGPGGVFVHERHVRDATVPRLAGWWGHDKKTRFQMPDRFVPLPTAEGWQLSNPPILALAALAASLEVFDEAEMQRLARKSRRLTGFLEFLLHRRLSDGVHIITPQERGAQLSLRIPVGGRDVFDVLEGAGVICDWREPDIIRVAPVPLYNSFRDALRFADELEAAMGC